MRHNYRKCLILIGVFFASGSFAFEREVAITIDDLPFVGYANNNETLIKREEVCFLNILKPLIENNVPVTGFVIAGAIEKGQWQWLEQFQQAGFVLGNHTYSHANLNAMSANKYITDVEKADKILNPLMSSPKFFRYPFLAEGQGDKKKQIRNYLAANNYVNAPVTIDSKDFVFNAKLYTVPSRLRAEKVKQVKPKYLAYLWNETLKAERIAKASKNHSKQILLIHANLLNSYCMDEIVEMYKKNGYRFISLAEALNEPTKVRDVAKDSVKEEWSDEIDAL